MVLMAIFLSAFAAVNACSKDNPCLYYGTCVSSNGTSFCKCQPGYTGVFCETKLLGLVVCGASYFGSRSSKRQRLSSAFGMGLNLVECSGDNKCFSGKYKGSDKLHYIEVRWRGCINASNCSQACAQFMERKGKVREGANNVTSCNGSCCEGDFCNALELFGKRGLVVNPCESKPCLNGGTCIYSNRNYTCVCQGNCTGRSCERCIHADTFPPSIYRPPPRACQSNPCSDSATCLDINGTYTCVCAAIRSGRNCETCVTNNVLTNVVGALVAVITALLLCIIYLIYRLKSKSKLYPAEEIELKNDDTNLSDITSQGASEISMSTITEDPANSSQPGYPPYMDLKPTHDKDTAYQSLDVYANENIHKRATDASLQGSIPPGEYMDLNPRQDVHYEKLTPKETTPQQSYEHMA